MSEQPTVLFERRGLVGRITLNRPDKYNSFTGELALALQAALDRAGADREVRAVFLTGAGRAFCSGQDLQEVTGPDAPGFDVILGRHLNPIVTRIRALEKPVVAAVNGVAAGAGVSLALACDIAVAAESAYFLQAFSRIGLIPDTGGTWLLPRLIGPQRAAALMMLAERVGARDAAAMGMIYQVMPDQDFDAAAFALAERLAHLPTRGLALTKRALQAAAANTFEQQLQLETDLQGQAGQTYDYAEGVRAFLEKREPRFRGE